MSVSKRLRFEILRRDNHACRYCGRTAPEVKLTVDHVTPEALGGSDDPGNLVAACSDCNGGKSSVSADAPLVADVAADAMRWSRAMQLAAASFEREAQERAELVQPYYDVVRSNWPQDWLPDDWMRSVDQFMRAGLPWQAMDELAGVARASRSSDEWRYFCGCCWTRIRQTQERAMEIARQPETTAQPGTHLATRWTASEVVEFEAEAIGYARDLIGDARLEGLLENPGLPPCRHGVVRHCGDPVCAVEDASLLMVTARKLKEYINEADAVCAEAEALLDG